MMMKSKVGIICIAAVATLAVGSPVFAQSFSASPFGTGNVLPSHYENSGKLVLDNARQNNGGLSAFAAAPVGNASAITVSKRKR